MIFKYYQEFIMVYFQTKIRDWIDIEYLNYDYLSSNPNAIEFLRENPKKINWHIFSRKVINSFFIGKLLGKISS